MLILTIRTDKPEAEIGLFEDTKQLAYETWLAHRQLSETIHRKIKEQLEKLDKDWPDIDGLIYFAGPGSFTGLRIGAAVCNALKDSLAAKLVTTKGESWLTDGINRLLNGQSETAVPYYGRAARTTQQKK